MSLLQAIMVGFLFIFLVFEILLMVRDRVQGKGSTEKDRGSRYLNFIAISVGLITAGIVQVMEQFSFPGGRSIAAFFIGFGIMILGFGLRIWAIVTLGKSFRTTVEIHKDQTVVKAGPYRLIRHPSYTGILLLCCGYGIAVGNWLSMVIVVGLPLLAFLYRIHVEERMLVTSLGPAYKEYQRHTKRLIPWIW